MKTPTLYLLLCLLFVGCGEMTKNKDCRIAPNGDVFCKGDEFYFGYGTYQDKNRVVATDTAGVTCEVNDFSSLLHYFPYRDLNNQRFNRIK